MKLKLLEKDKKSVKFLLNDSTIPFANALRRIMIAEVPTLAIEDVYFVKNDSVMYDEMIALRLGLIPLKTNLEELNFREECTCKGEGCPSCEVKFTLEKKGGTVYSKDLKSDHPEVVPVSEKIPITKLGPDKEIKLEAVAVLGKGKDHSKWQPGVIHYNYLPEIKVDQNKCDLCGKCIERCPRNILEKKGKKLKVTDLYSCSLCKNCEEVCPEDAIKISSSDQDFVFYVETFGQLEPEEIVLKASEIVESKCSEFVGELKGT